jgi:aminoglycoside phosphotransferase family enzyme
VSTAEITAAPLGIDNWLPAIRASADDSTPVEVVETPLSWVLLTSRHAYKIKKAVDLGEARYRSPTRRRQACIDEVWLNRRLAPGVHLGVVPVAADSRGELRLGGKGVAVEWAVKMRRLRDDRNMRGLITRNELTTDQVITLANLLANFYFGSPPETNVLDDLCLHLRRRVEDVEFENRPDFEAPIKIRQALLRIRDAQSEYLQGARMVLTLRVCDGRVVEGHGDLRPEHIFLERRPAIIDCVEYSAACRRSDALDDLCALTMECCAERATWPTLSSSLSTPHERRTFPAS